MQKLNLIRKTKTGKYYNISFKLDRQTEAGEYGDDYKGTIKLSDFIDLTTGEWLADKNSWDRVFAERQIEQNNTNFLQVDTRHFETYEN